MSKVALVVIDGQNDFLADGNESSKIRGALCIEGAGIEAVTLAGFIKKHLSDIDNIFPTLDSHQLNDCSHNVTWRDQKGNIPPPFTQITQTDIENNLYLPCWESVLWEGKQIASREWAFLYTSSLEEAGKPPLCLWPVHCRIGTWGCNVYPVLQDAYDFWCQKTNGFINYVTKGTIPYTEHYSAFCAEVPDSCRSETCYNLEFYSQLHQFYDKIIWAGWAGSHCLRFSALDFLKRSKALGEDIAQKCVFLEDASAAVPDPSGTFSKWRQNFLDEVLAMGATITTTKDFC